MDDMILSSLVHNENYTRKVLPYLKVDYFDGKGEKILFKLIKDHYTKYTRLPTLDTLKVDLENSDLSENFYYDASATLLRLEPKEIDDEWLVDNTEDWCKRMALTNAIIKAGELLDQTDTSQYGKMHDLVQSALAVSFDASLGHDYLEDAEARYDSYKEKEDHLECSFDMFNLATKGGFVDESLTIFMAPTGVGKSLALCNFAADFLIKGKNVVYFTLEMSEKQISKRIDANALDLTFEELENIEKGSFLARINRIKKRTMGKLVVKRYPEHQAHSGHFRHFLNELRLKKGGFKPDVIIVDYIGICASATAPKGADLFTKGKATAEEIRALGSEFGCRTMSAVQVNREGTKAGDFLITDIGESWAIAQTGDYVYGIVANEALMKMLRWKILRLKDRYNNYTTWMTSFLIGVDHVKQKLFNVSDDENEEEKERVVDDSDKTNRFLKLTVTE